MTCKRGGGGVKEDKHLDLPLFYWQCMGWNVCNLHLQKRQRYKIGGSHSFVCSFPLIFRSLLFK